MRWLRIFGLRRLALAHLLKAGEGVEGSEEVSCNGGVVAEIHLPTFRRHGHKADTNRIVQVQMFGTVFDELPGPAALRGCGGVEHAGLHTTRTEAAPVRLSQAQYQGVFDRIVRLEGLAKASEDFFVLVRILLGEDDESGRGEAMLAAVQAAAFFAGFGFWAALAAVAPVGFALAF
jgi:hypothetical protein